MLETIAYAYNMLTFVLVLSVMNENVPLLIKVQRL